MFCDECLSKNIILLNSYKRNWLFCKDCGSAKAIEKKYYKFSFLPIPEFKKNIAINESSIYNYFTSKAHIDDSISEGINFYKKHIKSNSIKIKNKKILDISGGNGHAIMQLQKKGAKVELTEFNEKAINYASEVHKIPVYKYDLNKDNLLEIMKSKYDLITMRACIMFVEDLNLFAKKIFEKINSGGYLIINRSVLPTVGVLSRVQLDDFSYLFLRQNQTLINAFTKIGFKFLNYKFEVDPTMYVYDNDLKLTWQIMHYFYEIRNLIKLGNFSSFDIRARDRRRSTLVFKKD